MKSTFMHFEGLQNRMALTRKYLKRKTAEYEALQVELAELRAEVAGGVTLEEGTSPLTPNVAKISRSS